ASSSSSAMFLFQLAQRLIIEFPGRLQVVRGLKSPDRRLSLWTGGPVDAAGPEAQVRQPRLGPGHPAVGRVAEWVQVADENRPGDVAHLDLRALDVSRQLLLEHPVAVEGAFDLQRTRPQRVIAGQRGA